MDRFVLGKDTPQWQCVLAAERYQIIISKIRREKISSGWILWATSRDAALHGIKIDLLNSIESLESRLYTIQSQLLLADAPIQIDGSGTEYIPFYLYLEKK